MSKEQFTEWLLYNYDNVAKVEKRRNKKVMFTNVHSENERIMLALSSMIHDTFNLTLKTK